MVVVCSEEKEGRWWWGGARSPLRRMGVGKLSGHAQPSYRSPGYE